MKERPLNGYFINHSKLPLSSENWFNGSFQDSLELYLKDSISLKSSFVRLKNQIDFSIFRHLNVKDVSIGKDNYFFRYTRYFVYGGDYHGDNKLEQDVLRLKRVQDTLKKKGKFLVFVIAPDKLWIYNEFLNDPNVLNPNSTKYYDTYVKLMNKYNCDFIDLNAAFLELKPKSEYALFAKGGSHWTEFGAFFGLDSIVNYIKKNTKYTFPKPVIIKSNVDGNPWFFDEDIFNASNLQFNIPENNLFLHPKLSSPKKERTTKAILCGDSFCHAICWQDFYANYFHEESTFWYYNRVINKANNKLIGDVTEKNARIFIKKSDIYIVLFSAGNVGNFEYGFLNHFEK